MVIPGLREQLLKQIEQVEEDFPLGSLNPLGAGGPADYFTVATDAVGLAGAVKAAIDHKLPYLVIGEASSLLFSDTGYEGLVIQNKARQCVLANDRSQIVVESGLPLRQFITFAAGHGFGGLTEFYSDLGSVGGALYSNSTADGRSIFSALRYVTLVVPPTKIKVEASVVRYKSDWLQNSPEETKLQLLQRTHSDQPQPVILNAQFQLTTVRNDEIARRIAKEALVLEKSLPEGKAFGPLFAPLNGVDVEELLTGSGVNSLRFEGVYPDRYHPNYLRSKGGSVQAGHIIALAERMAEKVRNQYSAELVLRYELVGAW